MTHPIYEEFLDLLGRDLWKIEQRMSFQSANVIDARICRLAADTITALRTQLAEANARAALAPFTKGGDA